MLTATQGYYNGEHIVIEEKDRMSLKKGDIFVLVRINHENNESGTTLAEKRRKMLSSRKYSKPSGRSAEEIDSAIKEMRENDRI